MRIFMKAKIINSVCNVKKTPNHTKKQLTVLEKKLSLSYPQIKLVLDVARQTQAAAFEDQPVPAFPHPSLKRQEIGCLSATEEDQGIQALSCRI